MLINDIEKLTEVIELAKSVPVVVYDLETTGLNSFKGDRLIGVALKIPGADNQSFYLPFRHKTGQNLPIQALYYLAPLLADPERYLMGWNLKFDILMTEADYISVHNKVIDVMLAAHLNNENEMSFALKYLGSKYVSSDASKAEQELNEKLKARKLKKSQLNYLTPEEVAPYAIQDVNLTWDLAIFFEEQLEKQGIGPLWVESNIYSKALINMELRGLLVDADACTQYLEHAHNQCEQLQLKMENITGEKFNPKSVPQLRKILGTQNTDKDALAQSKHPIAPMLLQYRAWQRAADTYYQGFLDSMDANCRIHPNLRQTGTISGRLSCQDPNLQALPTTAKDIYKVRHLIKASRGYKLVSLDYNQIEMRILAHYTNDPFLIDVYAAGKDIHAETAQVMGVDRDKGKRTNFSIVYGVGTSGLSQELKISEAEAKVYLDRYHSRIPGIRKLYRACENAAKQNGFISMWTGRRRHYREEDFTHKAMSNLIQGGVAELMRIAITRLADQLTGSNAHMLLQIHDDILFEIPEKEVNYWIPRIKTTMEEFTFRVPVIVDVKIGDSWGGMTKWVETGQMALQI